MKAEGQAAVVTGGGSGLGAATARILARAGARVAVVDVNAEAAADVAAEIGGLAIRCDVSDPADAGRALETAAGAHGVARVIVNCAGVPSGRRIVNRDGPMPLDEFRRVIEVNLFGTFNFMRLGAAALFAADPLDDTGERGVIVNTASVAAFEGQVGQSAYSASKGAVASLTLPAAREFASFGIRVMTIAPGLMETPMLLSLPREALDSLSTQAPFPRRLGRPDEYAALALHIVENSMLNGEVIRLDGALRLAPR